MPRDCLWKRVLWMSRHRPCPSQIQALREMYGNDVVIDQESRPFDDARQIVKRYLEDGHYDDMVIVAPLSVISIICDQGIHPLMADVVEENDPSKIEFRGARNQGYRFTWFLRVKRVAIEYEEANPLE